MSCVLLPHSTFFIRRSWYLFCCRLLLLLLLLLLLTAIELPLGGSSPYTNTDRTNNKYT